MVINLQTLLRSRRLVFGVLLAVVVLFAFVASVSTVEAAGIVDATWARQFGGVATSTEVAQALDADGSIYIIGYTDGALPGETNLGTRDVFIRKYDTDGNIQWTDQFGTTEFEEATNVSTDGTGVYMVGHTSGTLPGETNLGNFDGFIRKYDTDGNVEWTDQFGTTEADEIFGVSSDGTNVYVVGNTEGTYAGETNLGGRDAVILRYDTSGNQDWVVQFGTSALDDAQEVDIDSGNAYIAGMTEGSLPGETQLGGGDAFLVAYDNTGTSTLTEQFGTTNFDEGRSVTIHLSHAYVSGNTEGTFPGETDSGGGFDAFVRKYDFSANEIWTRQFGASGAGAIAEGLDVGAVGVFVSGGTEGSILPDQQNEGLQDAFIRRYDIDGFEIWTTQFGTSLFDAAFDVAVEGTNLYVAGQTDGVFDGQIGSGGSDAFVAKFVQDTDGDGIYDNVDTDPVNPSVIFNDGTTNGDIQNEGQQILNIIDAAGTGEGIFSAADPTGGNAAARLDTCNNSAKIFLDSGEAATMTCGSAKIEAENGEVLTNFTGNDGTSATTTMNAGNAITFDEVAVTFEADPDNTEAVEMIVDGNPLSIVPIVARIQRTNPPIQCIDTNLDNFVFVAVVSNEGFDAVAEVDPETLVINGASPTLFQNGDLFRIRDLFRDGFFDLFVRVRMSEMNILPGEALLVDGMTNSLETIQGTYDAICVQGESTVPEIDLVADGGVWSL